MSFQGARGCGETGFSIAASEMVDASTVTTRLRDCIEADPVQVIIATPACACQPPAQTLFPRPIPLSESDYLKKRLAGCQQIYARTGVVRIQPCVVEGGAVPVAVSEPPTFSEPIITPTQSSVRDLNHLVRDGRRPTGNEYAAAKRRAITISQNATNRYANVIRGVAPALPCPLPSMKQPGVPVVAIPGCAASIGGTPFRVGARHVRINQ
jgi:hypothetical protein